MRILLALVIALLGAADASAATVAREGTEIVFRSAPGERDRVRVEVAASLVRFTGVASAGEGCSAEAARPRPDGNVGPRATCELTGVNEIRILAGAGDDEFSFSGPMAFNFDLGPGDDRLTPDSGTEGEPTAVSVTGGDGNDEIGVYASSATVLGEAGNDSLTGEQSTASGPSTMDGGPGNDSLKSIGVRDLRMIGGDGNDRLIGLADDVVSEIDCGPGADVTRIGVEDRPGAGCAPHVTELRLAGRGRIAVTGRVSAAATLKVTVLTRAQERLASGTLRARRAGRLRGTLRQIRPSRSANVVVRITTRGGGGDRETVSYATRLR